MMDWNCGGESTPESRRYSSSVRQVERERLIAAVSGILEVEVVIEKVLIVRKMAKIIEDRRWTSVPITRIIEVCSIASYMRKYRFWHSRARRADR